MHLRHDPEQVLRSVFGFAELRGEQRPIIEALVADRDALAVLRTGGGKSLCYQLPAICAAGTAIVISPLISLMKDQVDALRRRGIAAGCLHSALSLDEAIAAERELIDGCYKLFYVAPERLTRGGFLDILKSLPVSFFAVDEAHCVSMWGHDFRLAYRRIAGSLDAHAASTGVRVPRVALTATADVGVREDIVEHLGLVEPARFVSSFDRPNIRFTVMASTNKREDLAGLIAHAEGSSIVYTSTVRAAEQVYADLRGRNHTVGLYHGRLAAAAKHRAQEQFLGNEVPLLVATTAFGMGIDKPDVRNVFHYQMPGTIEAYYQEAGRAGRDGEASSACLLYSSRDRRLHEFFIDGAYPPAEVVHGLHCALMHLASDVPLAVTFEELAQIAPNETNARQAEATVKILEDQGILRVHREGAESPVVSLVVDNTHATPNLDYLEKRRLIARDNLNAMEQYCRTHLCRRRNLLRHFGEAHGAEECGNCDRCLAKAIGRERVKNDVEAAALMSACRSIIELGERYAAARVCDVLLGVNSARLRRRGLDQCPSFASLKHYSQADVQHLLRRLERDGIVETRRDDVAALALTERGRALLARLDDPARADAECGSAQTSAGPDTPARSPNDIPERVDVALRETLMRFRERLARQAGKPAFMVLPNNAVERIARKKPSDEAGLLEAGLSASRIRLLAPEMLKIIAEHERTRAVRSCSDDAAMEL